MKCIYINNALIVSNNLDYPETTRVLKLEYGHRQFMVTSLITYRKYKLLVTWFERDKSRVRHWV